MEKIVLHTEASLISVGKHTAAITGAPSGAPVVSATDLGVLVCEECRATWCAHIEKAIRSGADSGNLFFNVMADSHYGIFVPILPSFKIYAEVYFVQVNHAMANAFLWNHSSPTRTNEAISLGMICAGDGRFQLRQMVFAWLEDRVALGPDAQGCKAMSHSWKRVLEYVDDWKDRRYAFAHAWCIEWYEKCYRCLEKEGPSQKFDDDLLPR